MAKQQLLLIKDVDDLGKSGEIVAVRAGYARNFLLPRQKAVIASKHTLRMQEKLKIERSKQAEIDKKQAQELAKKIENITLATHVKVDPEGRMYGSVSAQDIVELFEKENLPVNRRNVQLKHPIKHTGIFDITLKLKEGVEANFHLKVMPEKDQEASLLEAELAKEEKTVKQNDEQEDQSEENKENTSENS